MDSRLDGARGKVQRSKELFAELIAKHRDFMGLNPFGVVVEQNPEAVVAGTGKLVSRVEESTLALHLILTESQAARGVDLCREIARQVFEVKHEMQAVRDSRARDWHELNDAKLLLAAMLSGLADEELPACRQLASASTDPRTDNRTADLAAAEIRVAIERWRLRLAEVATQANAQLRRIALASESEPAPRSTET